MVKSKKHPGFNAVSNKIQKSEGVSAQTADAILAASTRKVSASAKKKNPNLKKIVGKQGGM
jgi:hypothetical protein